MKLPPQKPEARQLGQPFRVADIGLATGHVPDMEGIDDQGGNFGRLEMREHALPINPCALHHPLLDAMRSQPVDQRTHVALEPAELPGLARHRAAVPADQHGHDVLHPVHVDPGTTLMDRFHSGSPWVLLNLREAPGGPARDAWCGVRDTGQFTVRAARFACATIRGADLAGWVRLAGGYERQTQSDLLPEASRTSF